MKALRGIFRRIRPGRAIAVLLMLSWGMALAGCSTHSDLFRDTTMDFGSLKTVIVMPFVNLTKDQLAAERVRDVFSTMLMASGAIYALPPGETTRGINSSGTGNPTAPSAEDVIKLGKTLKADAVITGVVREYGDVRSGNAVSDVISVSLQMFETQTGRVVWSASTTQGGVGFMERMFGGGGKPLNEVTEKAVNDLINKLFE